MATATTSTGDKQTLLSRLDDPMTHFQLLFGATMILLISGVTMVASASSVFAYEFYGNSWTLAIKQLGFALFGLVCMWRVSHWEPDATRRWVWLVLLGSIFLLCVVLVVGTSVNGQRNWIQYGPVRIQPSEIAKLALILWSANLMTVKYDRLHIRNHLLIPVVPVFVAILGLVILEGDLGTAMVMMPIMMAMYFFIGVPRRWLLYTTVVCLAGIAFYSNSKEYRKLRFAAWLHPEDHLDGAGFQLAHGKQAMGTGGWWGLGLGGSREKWGTLPEAHTDFIYAVVGEETGLLGTLGILFLFLIIGVVGFRIARHTPDLYVQLVAAGITTWIIVQMMVNVCAVLGVLPITGVPLPLVSYGGSSLIPTLIGLGILMSFARQEALMAEQE